MKRFLLLFLLVVSNFYCKNSYGQFADTTLKYPLVVRTFYALNSQNPEKFNDKSLFLLFVKSLDSVFNFNQQITLSGLETKVDLYDSTVVFKDLNIIDTIIHQRHFAGLYWGPKDEYEIVNPKTNMYCLDRYCEIIQPKINYILSKYRIRMDCDFYLSNFLISLTCPTCGVFKVNEYNNYSGNLHFYKIRGTECVIYKDLDISDSLKIRAGASIIKIEDVPTQLLPYQLLVKLLESRKDSITKLMIKQNNQLINCKYKFQEDTTKEFVYTKINDSVSLLKINSFNKSGFTAKVRELLIEDSLKIKTIIVDLRQCPGGLLIEAIRFCDLFLNENYLIGERIGGRNKTYFDKNFIKNISNPDNVLPSSEMFILTDTSTSSGAEIIAGALKTYKRAKTIGQGTAAQGMIRQTWPLFEMNRYNITLYVSDFITANKYRLGVDSVLPDEYIAPTGDSDNIFEYVLKKCL